MTDTTTTTNVRAIGLTELPEGCTACYSCGLPVPGDGDISFPMVGKFRADGQADGFVNSGTIQLAECDDCHALSVIADTIISNHPSLTRLGSISIVHARLVRALRTLDAVHQKPAADWPLETVHAALHRLVDVGQALAWASRYSPMVEAGARPDDVASEKYLYASAAVWEEARFQVARFTRDQLPPMPVACPTTGCASCGVASWPGRYAAEVWTRISGGRYDGRHLCPPCQGFAAGKQSLGESVAELAVLEYVDPGRKLRRKRLDAPQVTGLSLWADTGRTEPNTRPWQHLDLRGVRDALDSGIW